jgi:hypothetical protein
MVVKLLEGQVGRGRHWRECRRRRDEIGDVLYCRKMMEVFCSGGGNVSGRHLWLCGAAAHAPPAALTSLCHLYRPCSTELLLLLALGGFSCPLCCHCSLGGGCAGKSLRSDALGLLTHCLTPSLKLGLLYGPQFLQVGYLLTCSSLG